MTTDRKIKSETQSTRKGNYGSPLYFYARKGGSL